MYYPIQPQKSGADDAGVGTRGTPLRRPWSFPVRKASPRRCVGGGGEILSQAEEKLMKDRVERIDPWFWPASSVETKLGKVSAAGYHGWTARLSRGKAPMYDKGRKKDGNLELKRKRNSKKSSISKSTQVQNDSVLKWLKKSATTKNHDGGDDLSF